MNASLAAPAPLTLPARERPGIRPEEAPPDAAKDLTFLKRVLWFYIALWIFEGALRKWIVPGLATPLLVIRDPVLLFMFYLAFTKGIFPKGVLVVSVIVLGTVALFASIGATDTPLIIELYGLRASYLHLLLIFLIPKVLDVGDVRRLGKWLLLGAAPMAVLVLAQFVAGKGSWLNAGAGGATNSMLDSAYGHIRPSGTFSFTNGLTGFTAMASVFFLYHLLEKRVYPRWIWLSAAPALVLLIALSGSRLAAGLVFLIMSAVTFISIVHRRYRSVAFKLGALLAILVVAAGSFAVFKQGMDVFAYRFGNAANVRTGFIGRFFDSFNVPFAIAADAPTFGYGLGMGTNVAAGVLYGHSAIMLSEGEMGRDIMESGPLIGGLYLCLRACMVLYLARRSMRSLFQQVNTLPVLLFSGCFIDLLQGQFSQPTELGYATIACGLCLAAGRPAVEKPEPAPAAVPLRAAGPQPTAVSRRRSAPLPPPAKPSRTLPAPVLAPMNAPAAKSKPVSRPIVARGRSTYAERLHAGAPEPVATGAQPEQPQ